MRPTRHCHRHAGILIQQRGSITNRGGVTTLSLPCVHAGSIRSRGPVCRFGERWCSVRYRYGRHGRAHVSNAEAAAAYDILRCESAHHGDRLPKAAPGNFTRSCPQMWLQTAPLDLLHGVTKSKALPFAMTYLQGLDLTREKFVDLCILCGCDYTGSVKGIGPKKALNLIRQVRNGAVCVRVPGQDMYSRRPLWQISWKVSVFVLLSRSP